jgi:hypothetical protein
MVSFNEKWAFKFPNLINKLHTQGPIFRTFFTGKISGKIPRKIFPPKMLGKNGMYRGKSFEKSVFKIFQEIQRNFPRKVIFAEKMYEKLAPGSKLSAQQPVLHAIMSYDASAVKTYKRN